MLVANINFLIYTILRHNCLCVVWELIYYLFQGTPTSLCVNLIHIAVYLIFIYSICWFFSLFFIYNYFIFLIYIILFHIIKFLVYITLHHNWVCVICTLIYFRFNGIHIFFYFISIYIYVYCIFIYSLCWYLSHSIFYLCIILLNQIILVAIPRFLIYTILHLNWGCVIWAFIYYLFKGILISLCFVFIHNSMYHIFIFSIYWFFFLFIM